MHTGGGGGEIIVDFSPKTLCTVTIHILFDRGIQYPPAIRGGYVPFPPVNPKNPLIIDVVLKYG